MPGPLEQAVLYVLLAMPPWGAFLDHANFNFSGKVVAFYDGGAPGILYEL